MINRHHNIHTHGKRSAVISSLPITTTQPLRGSTTQFTDIEGRIPINKGSYNQITFNLHGNKTTSCSLMDSDIRPQSKG